MIKKIIRVILILACLTIIIASIFFKSFDYELVTSTQTISGLINPSVYVSDIDVPTGTSKICTGLFYINLTISDYNKEGLENYKNDGIMYNQNASYVEYVSPFSCTTIELKSNEVLEAFNRDWGKVNYYLKLKND